MKRQSTILRAASFALVAMLVPACQSRPEAVVPGPPPSTAQAPAADPDGTVDRGAPECDLPRRERSRRVVHAQRRDVGRPTVRGLARLHAPA